MAPRTEETVRIVVIGAINPKKHPQEALKKTCLAGEKLLLKKQRAQLIAPPGITVMVFKARRTRKVLRAEMFPRSTNSVM